ncbi:MAG: DNA polymerase/3'-5' exonuclease PolX [Actinomycetota bacterium]
MAEKTVKVRISNDQMATILDDIGDMLDIQGESSFRVRAYHRAANSIRSMTEDINQVAREGRLTTLPAVGAGLAERIEELLATGKMTYFEQLKEQVPPRLLELMQISGVGPKKAKLFYEELKITSIDELLAAVRAHKIRELRGMSEKTEENILKGIELLRQSRERILLYEAYPIASRFVSLLGEQSFVERAAMAGSLRRMKETIGDIDLLASSRQPYKVMDYFCSMPEVDRVLAKGDTKSSVIAQNGLQLDLRVVAPEEYGSALQYFTGSKEHSIHLRSIAVKRGLKISEYGIFDVKTGKRLGGKKEEDIYNQLGMDWMPPTLRENHGEIEAASEHRLPTLVQLENIKGDLQVHSSWSDGLNRISEVGEEAVKMGYSYIALTDHAQKLKIAGGMTLEEIEKRQREIDRINEESTGFTVLSGVELNIDNEGKVDYDEEILKRFDVAIASIHTGFGQSEEELTTRTVRAMENPYIHIIAHPTGRIIGKRPPFAINIEKVMDAAKETGTILELNSFPDRLDLKDDYLREAKRRGLKISIGTDAHISWHLRYMMYGVATAQRGWLELEDVINTYPIEKLRKVLKTK